MNLLEETIKILQRQGLSHSDVLFVTDGASNCKWQEFADNANFEYDSGYGGNEIHIHLKVVGKDWWLERGEYDGSEWWEYKKIPKASRNKKLPQIRE